MVYAYRLLFCMIIIIAFLLRMWDIDARSLWFDEAVEFWSANTTIWGLPRTVVLSYQPPLYTYLLYLWIKIDINPVWLRFLSVSLSILTISGGITLSRRLLGLRGALLTGLILATSPSEIRYAQEIGEYALMLFALTWMLNLLEWALRASSWKLWGIWMVFSVISVYTHYGSIITVISLTIASLFFSIFAKNWRSVFQQISICLLGFVITLPLFVYFLRQQIQNMPHNFIIPKLSVRELINFVNWMTDTFLFPLACWPYSLLPKWVGQFVVSMVFVVGVFIVVRPYLKEGSKIIISLIIAYTFYYVFVRTGLYGYGVPGFRYTLVLSPLFFLTCSAVIEYLLVSRKITLSIIVLLSICLISLYSLPNRTVLRITGNESRWLDVQEDLREVVKFWSYHHQIDEPTYVYYGATPAFQYYLMLYNIDRHPLPPGWFYVCWKGESESLCSRNGVFYGEFLRGYSTEEKVSSVRKSLGIIPSRFWIIFFSHISRRRYSNC